MALVALYDDLLREADRGKMSLLVLLDISAAPMLFNIYMRPLGGVIKGCGASCHQYADDTQLYISFAPTTGDAVLSLQRCLEAVLQWMRENRLRLNPDQTEVLRVGGPVDGGFGGHLMFGGGRLWPRTVGFAAWGYTWTQHSPWKRKWRR